jgi:hypothetical protein
MAMLQEWIHRLEVGSGTKYVRVGLAVLGFGVLVLFYNLLEYRHLSTPEGMDAAQVARQISRGDGFTTHFVRPLSVALVERHQMSQSERTGDFALLREDHPDLANPPLYPLVLAGAMKLLPFDHDIPGGRPVRRHQPDMLLGFINQALFFVLVWLVFGLARRWFDEPVAWLSAILLAGSELFWRFTLSGLPVLLLSVLFVLLLGCLTSLERGGREGNLSARRLTFLAAWAGALVGLGCLTRYGFGWLILPVVAFLVLFSPSRRLQLAAVALLVFGVLITPWLARNHAVSGTLFGTAGYAVFQGMQDLEGDRVERSLQPVAIDKLKEGAGRKLLANLSTILRNDLPRITGSWISGFFLVGLLLPFVDPGRGRLRLFVVSCLLVLIPVQALGRTPGLELVPEVHGGNLLVVLAPAVIIFGAALFFTLLDRMTLPLFRGRELVCGLFVAVLVAPLGLALLPPRTVENPISPGHVQFLSHWMEPGELLMSDVPWAVAWYGDRQCMWLTLRLKDDVAGGELLRLEDDLRREDFYSINDLRKPVRALYFSERTLNRGFFRGFFLEPGAGTWSGFILDGLVRGGPLPAGFPLRYSLGTVVPQGHFFLADRVRWRERGSDEGN